MNTIARRVGASLAGIAMLGTLALANTAPASAADNSYWLTNSSSNSGAFDCYVYKGGKWHKVNDGHTFKGMTRKTLFKCDHNWYATSVTGVAVTGKLKKNKNYHWSSVALKRLGDFKWAVAFQY